MKLKNTGKWIGLAIAAEIMILAPVGFFIDRSNSLQYLIILSTVFLTVWGAKAFKNHLDSRGNEELIRRAGAIAQEPAAGQEE